MERLEELEELARAVSRAVEATIILARRAERHVVKSSKPKRQRTIMTLRIDGDLLELTDKQAAALLVLKNAGGAEVLNTIARITGLNTKLGLGLAEQLQEKGLVEIVFTPQRKILVLTRKGWRAAEKAEEVAARRI